MKSWIRWVLLHGVSGAYLRLVARRGDPLGQLLADPRTRHDPYPLGDRIRDRGRLVQTPFVWLTADHEICRNVLRNKDFGVNPPDAFNLPAPIMWLLRATDPKLASPVEPPSMLVVDPPEHTRFRKLVAQAFTPRAIARLDDRIAEVTAQLLTELGTHSQADLIAAFAARLPVAIITEILGVPAEKREDLLRVGHAGAPLLDIGISWRTYRTAMAALRESQEYLEEHINRLLVEPGDNILSELATGGRLSKPELMATATLIAGAGFETTVNLIGNGAVLLRKHPDQLALLQAEPQHWPDAIEEILRFDSPVQNTTRTALRDIEIAGQRIKKGQVVLLLIGAANHDPAVFPDPHTFDVTRANAREHLSFSGGVHACLGASLARTEGNIALRSLFERFPDLRIDGTPPRRDMSNLRGYQQIPCTPSFVAQVA